MRKRLCLWELSGFLFTAALGPLLHFAYDWSGGSLAAAVISSVNESTWEHAKLLFVPLFLFSLVQVWMLGKNYPNLLAVRAVSILAGLALIPTLFYTYAGVWGQTRGWANIAVFFLAALGAFVLDYHLLRKNCLSGKWQQILGLILIWALAFFFIWCTFHPVHIGLWRDPVTGAYGIPE